MTYLRSRSQEEEGRKPRTYINSLPPSHPLFLFLSFSRSLDLCYSSSSLLTDSQIEVVAAGPSPKKYSFSLCFCLWFISLLFLIGSETKWNSSTWPLPANWHIYNKNSSKLAMWLSSRGSKLVSCVHCELQLTQVSVRASCKTIQACSSCTGWLSPLTPSPSETLASEWRWLPSSHSSTGNTSSIDNSR